MCGLCGFVDPAHRYPADGYADTIDRMSDSLAHRGPDDRGHWLDLSAGVALGHRRLSILDLSAAGHQPMASPCGRYILAFNGEIYNHQDLRRELEAGDGAGIPWRGHSDTEVLLAAIVRWGIAGALRRFNGMFVLALWDCRVHRLYLARDRLGEKPLYYGWSRGVFLFGSELKALRLHPAWEGRIDRGSLALMLRHNYIPAPYSIYQGIGKLLPGRYLALTRSGETYSESTRAYWSASKVAEDGIAHPFQGDAEEGLEVLDGLLRDAVKLRMEADVPLGGFLSGGIDSSLVATLMQAESARRVRTFSIGFHEPGYDEATHAKSVARHLGSDHTELYVTAEQALAVIPRLPHLYDEPFADSSQIPTFLVSEMARQHVTVCLSGDGGDELFGGYNRYFWGRTIWNRIGLLPRFARSGLATAIALVPTAVWDRLFGLASPLLPARFRYANPGDRLHKLAGVLAVESPETMYRELISHWKQPASVVIGAAEPATALTDASRWAKLADFTQRMMYLDAVSYLPDDILVKVDRASMGVGLEARVPMLDHRLFELAWSLPLDWKIRGQEGKWLLRKLLHRYVPAELVARPKMGFGVPIDAWLRGPLRAWGDSLLDRHRLREQGYFDPTPIHALWNEHLSGRRNGAYHLWDLLMFQAWLETHQAADSG